MKTQAETRQQRKIIEARREVVHRLNRVQASLDRELSWFPKGEKWLLPLVAFATGAALASGSKKKRPSQDPD